MRLLLPLLLLSGCTATVRGVVQDDGLTLLTPEGKELRLVLQGDAVPVGHLKKHTLELTGNRSMGRFKVKDWSVTQSISGMASWVGKVETRGHAVGMNDRNTGGFYTVDAGAARDPAPYLGDWVLVEGYVTGPHTVRVMYWQVLH